MFYRKLVFLTTLDFFLTMDIRYIFIQYFLNQFLIEYTFVRCLLFCFQPPRSERICLPAAFKGIGHLVSNKNGKVYPRTSLPVGSENTLLYLISEVSLPLRASTICFSLNNTKQHCGIYFSFFIILFYLAFHLSFCWLIHNLLSFLRAFHVSSV